MAVLVISTPEHLNVILSTVKGWVFRRWFHGGLIRRQEEDEEMELNRA